MLMYNGAPVMWRSKIQNTTALSTAEAEYYSASTAATEVMYIRALLDHMGFGQRQTTPVFEDNNACIEWGNNVIGGRERAKHIDIRKHFAHEAIQNGFMRLIRVPTSRQLADIQGTSSTAMASMHRRPRRMPSMQGILRGRIQYSLAAFVLKRGRAIAVFKSSHVGP
jgi:hypothetical protein